MPEKTMTRPNMGELEQLAERILVGLAGASDDGDIPCHARQLGRHRILGLRWLFSGCGPRCAGAATRIWKRCFIGFATMQCCRRHETSPRHARLHGSRRGGCPRRRAAARALAGGAAACRAPPPTCWQPRPRPIGCRSCGAIPRRRGPFCRRRCPWTRFRVPPAPQVAELLDPAPAAILERGAPARHQHTICDKYGMHKVWYGRRWRCRR